MNDFRGAPLQILIPMKPLSQGKTRLRDEMTDLDRKSVVMLMLDKVLDAASDAFGGRSCNVVGGDDQIKRLAAAVGAVWSPDGLGNLNRILDHYASQAFEQGSRAIMYLPPDIPAVTSDDLRAVVAASEEYSRAVGVRAASDGGTNALLLSRSCVIEFQLGPNSFELHKKELGYCAGTMCRLGNLNLEFDVDTMEDVAKARQQIPWFRAAELEWQSKLAASWSENSRGEISL